MIDPTLPAVSTDYAFSMSTPALLFPAISLLMLAYTNRFVACTTVIRSLHDAYSREKNPSLLAEVDHLRHRLHLIRWMQLFAVLAILADMVSMFALYARLPTAAEYAFGGSLVLMILSLIGSVREITISVRSVEMHIRDMLAETAKK